MTDIGTVVEVAQAFNNATRLGKEVGTMVSEGSRKNGHNGNGFSGRMKVVARAKTSAEADADFSDDNAEGFVANPSESKALASYKLAKEYMSELGRLHSLVDYRQRIEGSRWLQVAEGFKSAVHSYGFLEAFRRAVPKPTPELEAILNSEIAVITDMQKHVRRAIGNWQAVVNQLQVYDAAIIDEFNKAKNSFLSYDRKVGKMRQEKTELEGIVAGTPIEAKDYVEKKVELDNLKRQERNAVYKQEEAAQRFVYTSKQSEVVQAKEEMVEKGLHVFRLVNDYVGTFLTFVQNTRAADSVIPKLAETIHLVNDCYMTLSSVLENRNAETTEAAESLTDGIRSISYKVFPNAHTAVQRQKGILEKADNATNFTEQAWKLIRGNGYQAANGAG